MGKSKSSKKKVNSKNIESVIVKSKKTRMNYSIEKVQLALQEVNQGKKISYVSHKYDIPRSTLHAKVKGKYADKKPGPSSVLNADEERELVDWIKKSCELGFSVNKTQLLESVKIICQKFGKKNPFTDNIPGRAWYNGFMHRNPDIVRRVSKNNSLSKAKVSESSLRRWSKEIKQYLVLHDALEIEPGRVFNCDETDISLNPIPTSVLAGKREKNVYKIVNHNEKQNLTVLVTASAAGKLAPTLVLFAGKILPKLVSNTAPNDFAFGISDNGCMLAQNFYKYIVNIFEPWLVKENIKRPVVLYIDGHSSHLTLHLSKFCAEKEIILIALHANASHIIQPLEVAFFKPLKSSWQKSCQKFYQDTHSVTVQRDQFAPLLKKTFESMDLQKILENGFCKCGLYPFDINAVDFSKVIIKNTYVEEPASMKSNSSSEMSSHKSLVDFEKYLSNQQLTLFQKNVGPNWSGLLEDKNLYNIWYSLKLENESLHTC